MAVVLALANYPITQFPNWEAWKTQQKTWIQSAVNQGANMLVFPEYGSMELTSLLPVPLQADLQAQLHRMQSFLPDFISTFQTFAKQFNCYIVAPSFPVWLNDHFVNRAYVFSPSTHGFQDKYFMTRFENETWGISQSNGQLTLFKTALGNFGVQLCFDIEFPIGGHKLASAGADFLLVPSCTETRKGATRVHVGARARAMEQQLFVGVSQTVGEANWSPAVDINYGYTAVYTTPDLDFDEAGIAQIGEPQKPGWLIYELNLHKNMEVRATGQVLNYKHSQKQNIALEGMHVVVVQL